MKNIELLAEYLTVLTSLYSFCLRWYSHTYIMICAARILMMKINVLSISLRVPPGCSTELNHAGYSFLMGLFEKYDRDKDNALSPQELIDLFSTCPVMPWGPDVLNSVHTNEKVCSESWESYLLCIPDLCDFDYFIWTTKYSWNFMKTWDRIYVTNYIFHIILGMDYITRLPSTVDPMDAIRHSKNIRVFCLPWLLRIWRWQSALSHNRYLSVRPDLKIISFF